MFDIEFLDMEGTCPEDWYEVWLGKEEPKLVKSSAEGCSVRWRFASLPEA
jgi:hypothetical protein